MTYDEISQLIAEESSDIVYLSDPESYELIYLNKTAQNALGFNALEEWKGKPCYQVLQKLSEPCPFCTNNKLSTDQFYEWERYNESLNKYFSLKDKLIMVEGRKLRLELAMDVTQLVQKNIELGKRLELEQTLVSCIQVLNHDADIDRAINKLLQIVATYYGALRAYIFEINYEKETMSNTYEWCSDSVEAQIQHLKCLPLSALDRWMEPLKEKGEFYITSLGAELDESTMEFQILDAQDIESLMAAPLLEEGKITGFLGVDNPTKEVERMELLRSVTTFIIQDIRKRRLLEQLAAQGYTDTLTGLDNRNCYLRMIEKFEEMPPETIGIAFIDINGLKMANDTGGQQFGDKLICHTADVLQKIFGRNVYRIGGDEFVVLYPDCKKNEFNDKTTQLRKQTLTDDDLRISIGTAWYSDCADIMNRVTKADELMYIDKQKYYGMRLESMGNHHASLSRELMKEIEKGRFEVYLQPKIDLKTDKLSGAEALVRKRDSKGQKEEPAKFIPLYESEGIIRHIDFFVLAKVCETLNLWKNEGRDLIKIAVNVSKITLMEYEITNKLLEVCRQYDVDPSWINIEVTESIGTMEELELRELLDQLQAKGFTISLDDFGSEYSNLAILTSMDFNEIKLDKSLINHLEHNQRSRVVTEHTIKMCQDLELMLSVAEGIETEEQRELLKEFDCSAGQGYFFDKPMPIDEFALKYILN